MTEKIKSMLETAVNRSMPVLEDALPDNFPCVTFHLYNEGGAVFGGGEATEETASCQVDIWYRTKSEKVNTAIKNIKNAIRSEKYFTHPRKESVNEPDKKIYHTYYQFELIVESEE